MPEAAGHVSRLAESGGRWKLSLGGNAHVPLVLPARKGSYWNIPHISRSDLLVSRGIPVPGMCSATNARIRSYVVQIPVEGIFEELQFAVRQNTRYSEYGLR